LLLAGSIRHFQCYGGEATGKEWRPRLLHDLHWAGLVFSGGRPIGDGSARGEVLEAPHLLEAGDDEAALAILDALLLRGAVEP
jgi:hypothetical protein